MLHIMMGLEDPEVKTTELVPTFIDLQSARALLSRKEKYGSVMKETCGMLWENLVSEVDGEGLMQFGRCEHHPEERLLQQVPVMHKLRAQEGGAAKHSASLTHLTRSRYKGLDKLQKCRPSGYSMKCIVLTIFLIFRCFTDVETEAEKDYVIYPLSQSKLWNSTLAT